MEWIAPTITAIGAIIIAWFKYNQNTKDKKTAYEIEQLKKDAKHKKKVRSANNAKIYSMLHTILIELECSRVFVIQPHPLSKHHFLSVRFEIKRNEIATVMDEMCDLDMANYASFSNELASRDFMYYPSVCENMKDKRGRALFHIHGISSCAIKRLETDDRDWVGSIVCDLDGSTPVDYIKRTLYEVANNIQYIIPEIE